MNLWDKILTRIEMKVNRHSFYTWFRPTNFVAEDRSSVTVRVPNPLFQEWLMKHYSAVIAEAARELKRPNLQVNFVADPQADAPGIPLSDDEEAALQNEPPPSTEPGPAGLAGLNPRYTFDTFIVGSSNQFAHAACRAVAEAPSRSYNPLFIYGGVGLGKTHLMHAVGHYVLQHDRDVRLTYISSERFMNEMINALRYDRVLDFRERYRSVDVLLVDDIQFLAGKEGTQTEFFHTFNALYDSQKQIVLSSDCPPHEIPELEERLRSRFEWGLTADIQSPDLETKVAILKKKAETEAVPLPDNVAMYIAGRIKSNIRELEGSLIRLIAYASLTGQDISLPLAQDVLKNILEHEQKTVTIEIIQRFIADYFATHPKVRAYIDRVVAEGRERGYVTTLLGRRRYLPELHARNPAARGGAERMAANAPIQGTASDVIKLAMVRLGPALTAGGLRARLVLQVHDELLLEVPEAEVAAVRALLPTVMESVMTLAVPLRVDVKDGLDWAEV